ncbi:hypothetical protein [Hymenobacter nivis]|nr:hypothetical protein [Hymenobacter nivis]
MLKTIPGPRGLQLLVAEASASVDQAPETATEARARQLFGRDFR